MSNQTNTEKLFAYRDQFCAIKLVIAMVLDNKLQAATSSIYPSISGSSESAIKQRSKLKNLYYIPHSSIEVNESTVLLSLIEDNFGPLEKLSSVVLSDAFAADLVAQTASSDAENELTLTLGNAGMRCAFTKDNGVEFTPQNKVYDFDGQAGFILSSDEQKNLSLLVYQIASTLEQRDAVQQLISQGQASPLAELFGQIELANGQRVTPATAEQLAQFLTSDNIDKVTTFIGINMYKPSW